ncbi:SAM-dependent chlorinase/fluorinase [Gangjinia marincola]|uniref:SAM-dependent chlorinase/fluorinase n=1 Tax=Gangjinia marincola TaxID=578463 RepID=A0ABP3XVT9_9FLAO
MPIITLTTDFGNKDHSVGAVKGAIYKELDQATIVDISHEISPFHIVEAAYIIKNGYKNFPEGTIHIIGVDSELTPENNHIALKLDNHYFICANNGIMSLIAAEIIPEKIVQINIHDKVESNFTLLDVFVKAAAHIARGGTLDVIGKDITAIKQLIGVKPQVNSDKKQIIGYVLYVDHYGNVVTNISRTFFEDVGKGRTFTISTRSVQFKKIHESYSDAINFDSPKNKREEEGKKIALFNSAGYIELAVYKSNPSTVGSAASLFGLKYLDTVNITFD